MMSANKRNPNFTEAELRVLSDEVEKQQKVLFSKHSTVATNAAKKRAWDAISSKVNALNSTTNKRTGEKVRKKWSTYTSSSKKKAAHVRRETKKTGGGPPPDSLTPLQHRIVGIMGDTVVTGISGGIDTNEDCTGTITTEPTIDDVNETQESGIHLNKKFRVAFPGSN